MEKIAMELEEKRKEEEEKEKQRKQVLFYTLYHYMKNFCNLIGLEQWYFSL